MEPGAQSAARARVLSYNFNILPRGHGGYQSERIDAFLECVDKYDIILLQEVYASIFMPYAIQKRFCYQKRLVDGLKSKGFNHYVLSRQPSYSTMLKYNIISDNGLVIASRFPIWHRGSYTFRSRERGEQPIGKGCLFAEIEIPSPNPQRGSQHVIFFNIHLRPDESGPSESTQVQQLRQFIDSVLQQIHEKPAGSRNGSFYANPELEPFVVAGDFNIMGIDRHSQQSTKKFTDLLNELENLGEPRDVLFSALGYHPPTRPARLFFPTQYKLGRNELFPQRQDYFLTNNLVVTKKANIEKFVASNRRPYTYLSDHFGIDATLDVPLRQSQREWRVRSSLRINVSPLIEGTNHEQSNPTSTFKLELFAGAFFVWLAVINLKFLLPFFILFILLRLRPSYIRVALPERLKRTSQRNSAGEVTGSASPADAAGLPPLLPAADSLAELWEWSLTCHRNLRCIGVSGEMGEPQWWTYGSVDTKVRELGNGLLQMGLTKGELLAVDSEAHPNALILELTCAVYGFVSVTLAGKSSVVRTLIDQHKIRVAFASRSSVMSLLKCRSTSIETVVCIQDYLDDDDLLTAKEVNITLLGFGAVQSKGRTSPAHYYEKPSGSDTLLMTLDNVGGVTEQASLVSVRNCDVVRDIDVLLRNGVVPSETGTESMVWYMPHAVVFDRICALCMLVRGNAVATSDSMHLHEVLAKFRPSVLVAQPSLFYGSYLQLKRSRARSSRLYNYVFDQGYQFLSKLIHVGNSDSPLVRFLFCRLYQKQLGGNVRRIIMSVSQESTSFDLVEYVTVCFSSCLFEVSYLNRVGVTTIDGVPAPGVSVRLDAINERAENAGIGKLTVKRSEGHEWPLDIAARWDRDQLLCLLGAPDGLLWPTEYDYCTAAGLERVYMNSRYVADVFAYCEPLKPIIAIVYPNRDLLEFEFQLYLANRENPQTSGISSGMGGGSGISSAGSSGTGTSGAGVVGIATSPNSVKTISWTSLVEYATSVVLNDLHVVCEEGRLHPSQFPQFVHLHPHAFRDYSTFLTPFGQLRRACIRQHFSRVITRVYCDSDTDAVIFSPTGTENPESDGEASVTLDGDRKLTLKVPVTVDIGGTFAKIAYVMPPGAPKSLPLAKHESSSLSDRLGLRTFVFFEEGARRAAEEEVKHNPGTHIGTLRFAKIPSDRLPLFAEHMKSISAKSLYAEQYMHTIRATGGGAFKYANLARSLLDVQFDVVREMDAVVRGLNLVIRLAPDSIFTVDFKTDKHYPHKLVSSGESFSPFPYLLINIGSGISFIKCTDEQGAHVRVGGSPIGGATFWGLTRIMTSLTSWEEVTEIMRLDGPGDNKNVDLLVGDIYGYNAKDLPAMLSSETLASCFGKVGSDRFRKSDTTTNDRFTKELTTEIRSPLSDRASAPTFSDLPRVYSGLTNNNSSIPTQSDTMSIDIVRSLLNMIASNVTQLAFLHARLHNVPNIFFAGGFVRDNPLIWTLVSSYMHYWSGGEVHAHFLEHDGYLGVLGCAII